MWNKIGQLVGGNLLDGANRLVKTIWGSAESDAQRQFLRRSDSLGQFAAEFRHLEDRTWWDAFVDGLNRLPRPTLVVLVLGYFVLSYIDPAEFQVLNTALEGVPQEAWFLLGAIVTFYFGARELEKKRRQALTLTKAQFAEQQARISRLRGGARGEGSARHAQADAPAPERLPESDRPLSDAVIRAWNERHNPAYRAGSGEGP